jgi:heterogeneous nuclear ribonucleoprotein U-like protein 1
MDEPTHYSKLDLKKMKVDELKAELLARNLDTKGLKAQLLNRLKEAIESEKVFNN